MVKVSPGGTEYKGSHPDAGHCRRAILPRESKSTETAYTLHQPGRLLDSLVAAMADRLRPGRSGWSASVHLGHDLERFFGIRAPIQSIERALQQLAKDKRIQRMVDDSGTLWYKLRRD